MNSISGDAKASLEESAIEWAKGICKPAQRKFFNDPSVKRHLAHWYKYNRDARSVRTGLYVVTRMCRELEEGKTPEQVVGHLKDVEELLQSKIDQWVANRHLRNKWSMIKNNWALLKTSLTVNGVDQADHVKLEKHRCDTLYKGKNPLSDQDFTRTLEACRNNEELLKVWFLVETVQRPDTIVQLRWDGFPDLDKVADDFMIFIDAARSKDRIEQMAPIGSHVRYYLVVKRQTQQLNGTYDPHGLIFKIDPETFCAEITAILERVPG